MKTLFFLMVFLVSGTYVSAEELAISCRSEGVGRTVGENLVFGIDSGNALSPISSITAHNDLDFGESRIGQPDEADVNLSPLKIAFYVQGDAGDRYHDLSFESIDNSEKRDDNGELSFFKAEASFLRNDGDGQKIDGLIYRCKVQ